MSTSDSGKVTPAAVPYPAAPEGQEQGGQSSAALQPRKVEAERGATTRAAHQGSTFTQLPPSRLQRWGRNLTGLWSTRSADSNPKPTKNPDSPGRIETKLGNLLGKITKPTFKKVMEWKDDLGAEKEFQKRRKRLGTNHSIFLTPTEIVGKFKSAKARRGKLAELQRERPSNYTRLPASVKQMEQIISHRQAKYQFPYQKLESIEQRRFDSNIKLARTLIDSYMIESSSQRELEEGTRHTIALKLREINRLFGTERYDKEINRMIDERQF